MKLVLIFVIVALLFLFEPSLARRRTKSSKAELNSDTDSESITYKNKADLEAQISDLKQQKSRRRDEDLTEEEIAVFKQDETKLKKKLIRATAEHGEHSHEKAKALHALGGNLFKQRRFKELLALSKEIVEIHETLDGPEAEITARALGNIGAVAFRINKNKECEWSMKRALYIFLKIFGEDSREAMLHRGKMLTFHVPDAENTKGWSYSEYIDRLEDEL